MFVEMNVLFITIVSKEFVDICKEKCRLQQINIVWKLFCNGFQQTVN